MATLHGQMLFTVMFCLTVQVPDFHAQNINAGCLQCICQVEGCESQVGKCKMDHGCLSCGPFQIKKQYWIDCYEPGEDYESCTMEMDCSKECVRNYMQRYWKHCTGGRPATCEDYAMLHNGGPNGCHDQKARDYWKLVEHCCVHSGYYCSNDVPSGEWNQIVDGVRDGNGSSVLKFKSRGDTDGEV